jgi:hypothetical protein
MSRWKPAFSAVIGDVTFISIFSWASLMISLAIEGHTFDNIMRLDGLINLRIGIFRLAMYIVGWLVIKSSAVCLFFKNIQKRLFEIRDAEMMLGGSVLLLSAMMY